MLEVIKSCKSIKSAVIVTTDKVYQNLEQKIKFREDSSLGGHDMYSGSKAACEILTQSYIKSFFSDKNNCRIATVRSGNCIGGGDWTKDRIMKDCAEAFLFNKNITIRNPKASRPWQHVIEPLFGYLTLAEKLYLNNKYIGAWNFGPNSENCKNVMHISSRIIKFSKSKIKIIVQKKNSFYESNLLMLSNEKSKQELNWFPKLSLEESLKWTTEWYINYFKHKNMYKFTIEQIKNFENL
jgi:CDP-glucose 4,6-dehydratase